MVQELKAETAETTATSSIPAKMTYEEFLAWADEDTWAEWIDGKVIVMSPASKRHQQLIRFLTLLLQSFIESRQSGELLSAPFQMKLSTRPSGREPDLLFIAREHLDRLKNTYLDGPADMALEIISPESRARDRGEKFYEYEQAGVREYWLIDPVRKQAEFYRLDDEGIYQLVPADADGIFHSDVLDGLNLKVDWLWQEPLPMLMSVLKEWGLVKG